MNQLVDLLQLLLQRLITNPNSWLYK